jgi:hypothetical protein
MIIQPPIFFIAFFLTFLFLGVTGVAFILRRAWKVGKNEGMVFDAQNDKLTRGLGTATLWILVVWMGIYFAWGTFTLFKNTLI